MIGKMRKPTALVWWFLAITLLVIQCTAMSVTEGEKITTPTGATDTVITITGPELPINGTITIDVSGLRMYVASGALTGANIAVNDTAIAGWTGAVAGNTLTLTSGGNATIAGDTVTVTFTGAAGSPWIPDTTGEQTVVLTVLRTDTGETASGNFVIETAPPPPPPGLTVADGEKISSADGNTTPEITLSDIDLPPDGTLTINITALHAFVASGTFTDANIRVTSTAVGAEWSGVVGGDTLTLTSTANVTVAGETVTVTFTGAGGSTWIPDTGGERTLPLTVTRTDTGGTATFQFTIETALPPAVGLRITDGPIVTARNGNSTATITLLDNDLAENGTITIDIAPLHGIVANGTFTDANIVLGDSAGNATWTGAVAGDTLILTSAGGPTVVGESVALTFTGAAGSAWIPDTETAIITGLLLTTRTDTSDTGTITFIIETTPGPGGLTAIPGETITAVDGSTSVHIVVTDTPIYQYDTILIDVSGFYPYLSEGTFTEANVLVDDTAAAAHWTASLEYESLILKSNDGPTMVGEMLIVNFTGAGGNPWISNTGGVQTITLPLLRMDNLAMSYCDVQIDTVPPPGFTVTEGAPISDSKGATALVFTIADAEVPLDGTFTIDISALHPYVLGGVFTDANVILNDTAAMGNWSGAVAENTLTLTSAGGPTSIDETFTLTLTGANGSTWIPNTRGVQIISLTTLRSDRGGPGRFNVTFTIAPPPGFAVVTNFTASPTDGIAPLTVVFRDTSTGNATSWVWDFGDGDATNASEQHPLHTYATAGTYAVNLTAANAYGSDTRSVAGYIHAFRGAVRTANTTIRGMTLTGENVQQVNVNTSELPAALDPNSSVLIIRPPAASGWRELTLYALDGTGFSQNGTGITGIITGVHLVTTDIAPTSGFSGVVGTGAALWLSMDLPAYPDATTFETRIWEGTMPEFENKLNRVAVGNGAVSIGTAYAATITKTSILSAMPVTVHMSVDSGWNPSLTGGPGNVFIWRIAEDGNSGQILPTALESTDPSNGLEYYAAESPNGMSTFGISSFTGSNNPFQLISLAVQESASLPPRNDVAIDTGGSDSSGPFPTPTEPVPVPLVVPDVLPVNNELTVIERIRTNPDGIISQASAFTSTDGLVKVDIPLGVVAKNQSGMPLEMMSIRRIDQKGIPAAPPDAGFSFAGMAYDIQPEGATFSPPISVGFTVPPYGADFIVQQYNPVTDSWVRIPATYDTETRTLTAQVSHLCYFALFARSPGVIYPTPTVLTSEERAERALASTGLPIAGNLLAFVIANPVIDAIIMILIAIISVTAYTKMRSRREVMGVYKFDGRGGSLPAVDDLREGNRQKVYAGIIHVLNDIDAQLRDLEHTITSKTPPFMFPRDEATSIVEQFFYSCQVAEERIKAGDKEGLITKKQVHDLNNQLDQAVQKMVGLARQSESLLSVVVEKFGAEAGH